MEGIKKIFNFKDQFARIACDKNNNLVNGDGDVLERELASAKDYPEFIKTDFSILIGEIGALNQSSNFIKDILKELENDFIQFSRSKTFDEFINNFTNVIEINELRRLPNVVRDVIDMQVGILLSFSATIKNFGSFNVNDYKDSFNHYFFSENGFQTVSGDMVMRPKLPKVKDLNIGDGRTTANHLKTIGNQISAERYIRDIIRIIVETAGDSLYETRRRYQQLNQKYGADNSKKKLVAWFDSFGDIAEASLLPVVEQILNGIGSADLNPLIAASIGTFCSVVTRKATEHSYLTLLKIPL